MDSRMKHFDGVKFVTLLIIIASHTSAFMMYGQGSVAVALFYILSGFFMVAPMKKDGEEIFASIKGWITYYILKIVRIIPLYWTVLLFFYWISDTAIVGKRALLENMFFYNSYGHIWYLQHLVVCYICAPLIELAIYLMKKYLKANNFVIAIILIAVGFIGGSKLIKVKKPYLLWGGRKRKLRCGIFVIGMGVGYLAKALRDKEFKKKIAYYILDVLEILMFLTLSIFTGSSFLSKFNPDLADYHIGWEYPVGCSIIGVVLVLVVFLNKNGLVSKLLSKDICVRCGKASLGVYLIHYFMMEFFKFTPTKSFAMLCVFVFPLAVFLYEKVEEPMYKFVRSRVRK